MMCNNVTQYMINTIPYCGKGTVPNNISVSNYYVERLVSSAKGLNCKITMDSWFTNISLAKKLLKDYKLTIIGTIKNTLLFLLSDQLPLSHIKQN